MIDMGLSDSQIAGALHIKKSLIAELREGGKNVQSKENIKPEKEAGEPAGSGDPGKDTDVGEMPPDPGSDSEGPAGPPGDPGPGGINFVGGKKHMAKKKENDPDPEEYEYECPHCHFEFNEKSDTCPSCGGSLSGYDD